MNTQLIQYRLASMLADLSKLYQAPWRPISPNHNS